jgi:hypothetical protein
MVFQPDFQAREGIMLTEQGFGIGSGTESELHRKPLVAVFPHPLHGRLIERVILMVSHIFNYQGIRYRFTWKNSGVAYYHPEAEEVVLGRIPANFLKKKGQISLPFPLD